MDLRCYVYKLMKVILFLRLKNISMKVLFVFYVCLFFYSCNYTYERNVELNVDMHTFSNFETVTCKHLDWKANINFYTKQIDGVATWTFENKTKATVIIFDTYDLNIHSVIVNNKETAFSLGKKNEVYGSSLSIPILKTDTIVSVTYTTGKNATALQWLSPSQTAGKKMPYLFTQCESIQARSLLPCQDVPAIRITYNAHVQVPNKMMAVMSAKNPVVKTENGHYDFEMELPIPTYLIALAVGDISYKAIDDRCGVYTETSLLDQAANELSDIPAMMKAAEQVGGPYKWGKYDVLVAPPSFPIGGMENPRLTFATPTIIAGDKSLVSLIAHEMAHSWSGNLVTNSTWDDLWLNEGFTTYFERRIMETISGKSYTDMLWELGYQDMQSDLQTFGLKNPDTRLRVDVKGRSPEDAFSNIPYEKGAVFLRFLEESVGREKFDKYLNDYFSMNAFQPMTTEKALAFMDEHLFDKDTVLRNKLKVNEWVFAPGLPDNCPHTLPDRFIAVDNLRLQFEKTGVVNMPSFAKWTTHEWLQFLRKLPHPLDIEKMKTLDNKFQLSISKNSEIADEWYKLSLLSNYEMAFPSMKIFLTTVGRKKFLEPLYHEMIKTEKGKKMALEIFDMAKNNYHPLTAKKIQEIIEK